MSRRAPNKPLHPTPTNPTSPGKPQNSPLDLSISNNIDLDTVHRSLGGGSRSGAATVSTTTQSEAELAFAIMVVATQDQG